MESTEFMQARWEPSPWVLWSASGDRTVLLCLKRSRYYLLNSQASAAWKSLCAQALAHHVPQGDHDDATAGLTGTAGLRMKAFLDDFRNRGLVRRSIGASETIPQQVIAESRVESDQRRRLPSLASCAMCLATTHAILRLNSLQDAISWATLERSAADPGAEVTWLKAVARKVGTAAAFYPCRMQCLEQSLCLMRLARARGIGARLRFGVESHQFAAHAWVESDGQPVNDSPEHLRFYRPFIGISWSAGNEG